MAARAKGGRRWRRGWGERFDRPGIRALAWLDAQFVDHGVLRPLWNGPERFAADAWRANQPGPRHIRKLARQGVRTVINLRGAGNSGAWLYEAEACRQAGLTLIPFKMSSRGAPSAERILAFAELIERIERPVLLHCKSGADRSGFAAGLYLLLTGQGDLAAAKAQLSWRYLHFRGAKTGMLYEFFREYERYRRQGSLALLDWVRDVYDPRALERSFQPRGLTTWLVDRVLRRE